MTAPSPGTKQSEGPGMPTPGLPQNNPLTPTRVASRTKSPRLPTRPLSGPTGPKTTSPGTKQREGPGMPRSYIPASQRGARTHPKRLSSARATPPETTPHPIRTPAGVPACNRWLSNATPPDSSPLQPSVARPSRPCRRRGEATSTAPLISAHLTITSTRPRLHPCPPPNPNGIASQSPGLAGTT